MGGCPSCVIKHALEFRAWRSVIGRITGYRRDLVDWKLSNVGQDFVTLAAR
jgi:hypothetical protein